MYTDQLFTGQREITGLGIYHYNARFYSPKMGRFLSADTLIPSYINPQHLNRYMYVVGNPIRYNDPTGHAEPAPDDGGCYPCEQYPIPSPQWPVPQPEPPQPDPEEPEPPQDPGPIIVIPNPGEIILSPIIPGTSPLYPPTDGYCKALEQAYNDILSQIKAIAEEIRKLRKELSDTDDTGRIVAIEKEILKLAGQQLQLLKQADKIKNFAKNVGCAVGGWQ
jgi:RHS repeat-associated protein